MRHIDWLWVMTIALFVLSGLGIYRDRARYRSWFKKNK
jgi:uncharacterized membrane protein